jgi:wyosine [tRNA(Phe)-imidazoG37] synthetase (radical SAM superfamily)
VGVNLHPGRRCNFGCLYCQVDRSPKALAARGPGRVVLSRLEAELREVLSGLKPGGKFWREPPFAGLAEGQRRVADVAFSGDGEPTTFRGFEKAARLVVAAMEELGFRETKLVVITNSSGLRRREVRAALAFLDAHRGEVWAKLDAGTEERFRLVNRSRVPLRMILENVADCARARPIVIQSCFFRLNGEPPPEAEVTEYLARLREISARGGGHAAGSSP